MSKEIEVWIITLTNGATIEVAQEDWGWYRETVRIANTSGEVISYFPVTSILRIDKKV